MKKAFDQTVRDLKREVNKKVLKIPGIEQKVLDATSNEPWGPHGSLLADIAQATRNYHEYLIIMAILWKRINDTGKNWRHVYKALIVLEYLVANGAERAIDEIRERAYQISTLSSFQYIDSKGRDQGNNVRRRSQILVALVNDKERIVEVREKANASRHKFRQMSSFGGIYRSSSYTNGAGYGNRYDDDQYKRRNDDRSGYGYARERGWIYMTDDRYGRGVDFDRRDGEQSDKYGNRNDAYQGRTTRSLDNYKYGSRSKSFDKERAVEDDYQCSSRSSDTKVEDHYQEGRRLDRKFSEQFLDRKFSEQNLGTSPSYEEATNASRSPVPSERDSYISLDSTPGASSKPVNNNLVRESNASTSREFDTSDEFDPRGSVTGTSKSYPQGSASQTTLSTSNAMHESFEDPFGDGPFRAIPSTKAIQMQPNTPNFSDQNTELNHGGVQEMDSIPNNDSWDSLLAITYHPSSLSDIQSSLSSSDFLSQETCIQQNTDILAGILPPSRSSYSATSHETFSAPPGESVLQSIQPQVDSTSNMITQTQRGPTKQLNSGGSYSPETYVTSQFPSEQATQLNGNFLSQPITPANSWRPPQFPHVLSHKDSTVHSTSGSQLQTYHSFSVATRSSNEEITPPQGSLTPAPSNIGSSVHNGNNILFNFRHEGKGTSVIPHQNIPASTAAHVHPQPFDEKFHTKSTIWSDTLSRGLVNLNISGPKINPLADIGIDFDALNRKERMEKPVTSSSISTTTMGKAMGSATGNGRAAANTLRPSASPMVNSGIDVAGRPSVGMAMEGRYGNMHQQHIGMGISQGSQMQYLAASSPRGNASGSCTQQSNDTNYR